MWRRRAGHGRDSGGSSIPAGVRNEAVTHSSLFSLRSLFSSNSLAAEAGRSRYCVLKNRLHLHQLPTQL